MSDVEWRNYWVLYLDVMGASQAMKDAGARKRLAKAYGEIVDSIVSGEHLKLYGALARNVGSQDPVFAERVRAVEPLWRQRVRVFSDSIFVFFDPKSAELHSPYNAAYLPNAAVNISRRLWVNEVPHRGSLAYGECLLDVDRSIFLGEPLVRAHEWERQQEWLGISVEPSSLELARKDLVSRGMWAGPVPTKTGPVYSAYINSFDDRSHELKQPGYVDAAANGFIAAYRSAQRSAPSSMGKYYQTARFAARHVSETRTLDELKLVAGPEVCDLARHEALETTE